MLFLRFFSARRPMAHASGAEGLFTALLLSLALLAVLSQGEEDCTLHQLQSCLDSLQSVSQGSNLVLATTRAELRAVCRKLREGVSCVDDQMKYCFTEIQRDSFNHVVAWERHFLLEVCVAGPKQEAYLRHSPCYKNVILSEDKCAPEYRHLNYMSEHDDEQRNDDEVLKETCCAFNEFLLCKNMHVTKDCGETTEIVMEQYLDRISSSTIRDHCYTYPRNACEASSNATSRQSSLPVLLVALIAISKAD